jgi:hypothetical protein
MGIVARDFLSYWHYVLSFVHEAFDAGELIELV